MSTSSDLRDELPALLTIHDIAALLQLRRTAAYARTRDPDFPDPLVMSDSCYRWYAHEVLAYIDAHRAPKKVYERRAPSAVQGTVPPVSRTAAPRPRALRRVRRTPAAAPSRTDAVGHAES
ncbi:hypothetical protein [Nocardioides conyzicola]|uniref:helix-turn-helix transcriptional regulator n=1 Tax=Nocardioides conyzicola TaxID=1651781 RepID=UPI0031EF8074